MGLRIVCVLLVDGNKFNENSLSALFANEQSFPSLKELTLDYNNVNNITFLDSKCLENLTLIYLCGNQIKHVDYSILNRLEKLKILSLSK